MVAWWTASVRASPVLGRALVCLLSAVLAVAGSLGTASAESSGSPRWSGGAIQGEVGDAIAAGIRLQPAGHVRGRRALLQLREQGDESWRTVARARVRRAGGVTLVVPTATSYRGRLRIRIPARGEKPALITTSRRVVIRDAEIEGQPQPPTNSSEFEAEVLALVNQSRAGQRWCGDQLLGPSAPLALNAALAGAARAYAVRMGTEGFFAHVAPDGSTPSDRAEAAGYPGGVGENIGAGQETPSQVVAAWLGSPGHCQNLMSPGYTVIGIGHAHVPDSEYGDYWVQMFG